MRKSKGQVMGKLDGKVAVITGGVPSNARKSTSAPIGEAA
jgi:hypothetical protein